MALLTMQQENLALKHRLTTADIEALQKKMEKRSEEHTSELQSPDQLVCRLLLEKKKDNNDYTDSEGGLLRHVGTPR